MAYLGTKPANQIIDSNLIANSTITSSKIQDGTIVEADIANGAITTTKIADSNVTTAKINDAAVTNAKIADATIQSQKLASNAAADSMRFQFPTGNNQNFDNATNPGFYDIITGSFSGTSNAPPNYGYGNMLVMSTGNFITQVYYPHAAVAASFRVKFTGGGWISWRTFG